VKWLGGGAKGLRRGIKRSGGSKKKEGRGRERFLTSRRTPGTPRWRRRRGGSPSRRWRTPATAQRTAGEHGQRNSGRGRGNWGVSRVEGRSAGAQMREGERASEVLGSSGRGRGGCELHARRGRGVRGTRGSGRQLRGDGRADSSGPRAERERGKRARARGRRSR
jgi:hypothetical protein